MLRLYQWVRARISLLLFGVFGLFATVVLTGIVSIGGVALVAALTALTLGTCGAASLAVFILPMSWVRSWTEDLKSKIIVEIDTDKLAEMMNEGRKDA